MDRQRLDAAVELACSAKAIMEDEGLLSSSRKKGEFDLVTRIDLSVEQHIREGLRARFPEDQFLGEEEEAGAFDPERPLWILDPVDGTTNLVHRYPQSALSLGLMIGGEMRVGVIYNPYLGQLFTARKGGGAYLNGRPIRVSSVGALHEGLVNVGTSPYIRTHAAEDFALMHKVFLRCQDIRRCGAAALELAYVAAGCVEAFYDRDLKAWDYAAGKVILEEAGGRLTTVHGEETPPAGPSSILATNGLVHEEMLELLREMRL